MGTLGRYLLAPMLYTSLVALFGINVGSYGYLDFEKGSRQRAVVIDAGSAGTRVIYFDLVMDSHDEGGETLYPKIQLPIRFKEVENGLVYYLRQFYYHWGYCCRDEDKAEVDSGLLEHMKTLRMLLDTNVPPHKRGATVVLVRATAGFRLLDSDTYALYTEKMEMLFRREFPEYAIRHDIFKVYSGTEEAAAAFVAMKSLVSTGFNHPIYNDIYPPSEWGPCGYEQCEEDDSDDSGVTKDAAKIERCDINKNRLVVFEVGGTSAQVAVELNSPSDEAFSQMQPPEDCGFLQRSTLDSSLHLIHYKGQYMPVMLRSFLGQGMIFSIMKYLRMIKKPGETRVNAACLPIGVNVEIEEDPTVVLRQLYEYDPYTYDNNAALAIGTSDYETCRREVKELIERSLVARVEHQPGVPIYGIENFIFLLKEMSVPLDGSVKITPNVLLELARTVCGKNKASLSTFINSTMRIQHICFGLTFLSLLAKEIFNLADDAEIIVKEQIHNTPATWAIGTVLLELPIILRKAHPEVYKQDQGEL